MCGGVNKRSVFYGYRAAMGEGNMGYGKWIRIPPNMDPEQADDQSCEMSNFLHGQKFEFKMLPQKRVNPGQSKLLLDWFATFVIQLDIFIEFGLNVNVPGLKSPH